MSHKTTPRDIDVRPPSSGRILREDNTSLNLADWMDQLSSPFGDIRSTNITQLIELKPLPNVISAIRDITSTTQASITAAGGEKKLSLNADGTGSARLQSAERGRYVPGLGVYAGVGIRMPDTPTGGQELKWGYYDDDNGYHFGRDATGLYIRHIRGGSEVSKVRRSDWDDPLDGTGPSGVSLDMKQGAIYRADFVHYGYGPATFKIATADPSGRLVPFVVHKLDDSSEAVTLEDPDLPLRVEADNNGTAETLDVFVGGRQFAIVGDYNPNRRITTNRRLDQSLSGTTRVPTVSFQRKSAYLGTSVKVASLNVFSADDLIWEIRTGVGLTGESFGTPVNTTTAETAVQSDVDATAFSGGEKLDEGFIKGGQGNQTDLTTSTPIDFDFIGTDIMTLLLRKVSGSGGSASTIFKVREEW